MQIALSRSRVLRSGLVVPLLGLAYVAAVLVIANVAFTTADMRAQNAGEPARTGAYDSPVSIVSPVATSTIVRAIKEPNAGRPAMDLPVAAHAPAPSALLSAAAIAPAYDAVRHLEKLSLGSVFSRISTGLRFSRHARPHRR
jgi:hypothetical protein